MFKHLVWISAVTVALCAAIFSVTGIATLFSAKFWAVVAMASSLEIGKLVMASYLYRWWKKTPILLKTYAVTAVGILMIVTSIGIYGYLTAAYASVAAVPQNTLNEISFAQTRQNSLNEIIQRLQVDNATINSRQSQAQAALDNILSGGTDLSQRSAFANLRQEIANLDVERQSNNVRTEVAVAERDSLENVKVTKNAELNTNSDIGPFIYVARTLDLPLDTVVKWFVLILIFVFDPLAISLILAYNNIVVKEMMARGEEIDETTGFSPFWKKSVKAEVAPKDEKSEGFPRTTLSIPMPANVVAPKNQTAEVASARLEEVKKIERRDKIAILGNTTHRNQAPEYDESGLQSLLVPVVESKHEEVDPGPDPIQEELLVIPPEPLEVREEVSQKKEEGGEEKPSDIYGDPTPLLPTSSPRPPNQWPLSTTNEFPG